MSKSHKSLEWMKKPQKHLHGFEDLKECMEFILVKEKIVMGDLIFYF